MQKLSVILAGGDGTRFWPMSRRNLPKQFLNIFGKDIMVNETINRLSCLISYKNTYIIVNNNQLEILKNAVDSKMPNENIFIEPLKKNTAPCITYASLSLKKRYKDAVIAFFPSDHYIKNESEFEKILKKAFDAAQKSNKIITIGIKPSYPSTAYGYIKYKKQCNITDDIYKAEDFIEKPEFNKADEFYKSKNYLWNSGIYICKISVILKNIKKFLPEFYKKMYSIYKYIGTDKETEELFKIYSGIKSISIDYGVIEKSNDILVIPGSFGWNDVGSWDALMDIMLQDKHKNIIKGKYVGIGTSNCIICSTDKLIAAIGIDDLIIAEAKDAVLICKKEKAQEVKNIIKILEENDMGEYI